MQLTLRAAKASRLDWQHPHSNGRSARSREPTQRRPQTAAPRRRAGRAYLARRARLMADSMSPWIALGDVVGSYLRRDAMVTNRAGYSECSVAAPVPARRAPRPGTRAPRPSRAPRRVRRRFARGGAPLDGRAVGDEELAEVPLDVVATHEGEERLVARLRAGASSLSAQRARRPHGAWSGAAARDRAGGGGHAPPS